MVTIETVKVNTMFQSAENEVGPYYKMSQNPLVLPSHCLNKMLHSATTLEEGFGHSSGLC